MGTLNRFVRDNNTVYISVQEIKGHKKFKISTFENDIALLILASNVPNNNSMVQPIALPTQSPTVGAFCEISGWGATVYEGDAATNLMAAYLNINSRAACNARTSYNGAVLNGMFCAGPFTGTKIVDSCQGDSGGPLTCDNVIVGITSNGRGCALPNFPGVYIDVFHYRNWILAGDSSTVVGNFVIILSTLALSMAHRNLY